MGTLKIIIAIALIGLIAFSAVKKMVKLAIAVAIVAVVVYGLNLFGVDVIAMIGELI